MSLFFLSLTIALSLILSVTLERVNNSRHLCTYILTINSQNTIRQYNIKSLETFVKLLLLFFI